MHKLPLVRALALTASLVPCCYGDWNVLQDRQAPLNDEARLEVMDAFVEMRSGPGRGYPVFHVIEQGEVVEVLKQRLNWYQIRSSANHTGWTKEVDLARTLELTGIPANVRNSDRADRLQHSWQLGFNTGIFMGDKLEDTEKISLNLGYRPLSWLGTEIEAGKANGEELSGSYYGLNLIVEPIFRWKFAPFLLLGAGNISLQSESDSTVQVDLSDSNFFSYGAGINYYLSGQFVFRSEYRRYSLSDSPENLNINNIEEWKLGFSTFF